MRRRTFLSSLTAGMLAAPIGAVRAAETLDPARVLLIFPDISPATDLATLQGILRAISGLALPACLVVHPDGQGGAASLAPEGELARLLRDHAARFPGLIEISAWSPDLRRKQPYAVARDATKARSRLIAGLWGKNPSGQTPPFMVSIATDYFAEEFPVDGVASAGFRNVIVLPDARSLPSVELTGSGVLMIQGGTSTDLSGAELLLPQAKGNRQVQLVIPSAGLESMTSSGLQAAFARLADSAKEQELAGRSSMILPRELLMRTDGSFRRQLALHLTEAPLGDQASARALVEFRRQLDAAGMRYSIGESLRGVDGVWPEDRGYWIALPRRSPKSAVGRTGVRLDDAQRIPVADRNEWRRSAGQDQGIAVVASGGPSGMCGLDDGFALHLPVFGPVNAAATPSGGDPFGKKNLEEGLVLVEPDSIAKAADRDRLLRSFRAAAEGGGTEFVPLDRFASARIPDDPVFVTCLLADRYRASPMSGTKVVYGTREDLIADAAIAWSYFVRGTNRKTGLSTSTTVKGDSATGFIPVTMWEMGSMLNAVMAAHALGFVDDEDFTSRTGAILRTLAHTQAAGRSLPPEWIDSRTIKSSRNFNSFDTGRFLIALDRLRRHPLSPKGIEKLVAGWDFGRVILDRRLHSLSKGTLVDDYNSNYTEYAATGFRAWGYDVTSPFESIEGTESTDQQMALLYSVAAIGSIGAEPALLELLDRGSSPTAGFLADVLFAAQSDLYERTGQLVFPSETPLDRSPWFAFQGYRVDKPESPWTITFDDDGNAPQTESFKTSIRANSPKAAYLWHALRPSQISWNMVVKTRAIARSEYGFLSAIYAADDVPTLMYSDLNTNSIILQAISSCCAEGETGLSVPGMEGAFLHR